MSDKWPRTIKGIFLALLAFTFTVVFAGCGEMSSSTVPTPSATTPSLSLEAYDSRGGSTSSDNLNVRANSRDLLEVVATVTGLIRSVGFFIPPSYGTWVGGATGAEDGFQYYIVDDDGKARAVLTAGVEAGRQEIVARYLTVRLGSWVAGSYIEARLLITFDFATLTIFPNTIVLNGPASKARVVEVRGALPPVEWWVSHVDIIGFHIRDETSIYIFWKDSQLPISGPAFPEGSGTLYVKDAEGQIATASVYLINTGCSAAIMTVSPTNADFDSGVVVTITVTDPDRAGQASVTVSATGGSSLASNTLAAIGIAGVFSVSTTYTVPTEGTYSIIYSDIDDPGNNCSIGSVSVDMVDDT